MQLQKLLDLSKELDNNFTVGKGLKKEEILNKSLLALMVETGEVANELNNWKYWKNKKSIDNEKVEGELGDVFCVLLSICNQLGFNGTKIEEIYMKAYNKNVNRIEEGY